VVKINKQSVVKFIKSIIYRFRVPNRIITGNGSQFTSGAFQGYCEDFGIRFAMPLQLIQKIMDRWSVPMQKY
jgi:transposase InsO family protein